MSMKRVAMLLALLVCMAGCSGASTDASDVTDAVESVDLPTEVDEAVEEATEAVENLPTEEVVPEITEAVEEEISEAVADPAAASTRFAVDGTYSDAGVTLKIDQISFIATEDLIEGLGSEGEFMADQIRGEGPVFVGIGLQVANESGQDIDFYPDQGTLQIGSQQLEPTSLLSDNIGGTMLAGTENEGAVIYPAEGTVEDLAAVGVARYVLSAPASTEDFSPVAEDVDITFEWTP